MKANLESLIILLEDPDPGVFESVSRHILDYGPDALPFLEKAGNKALTSDHLDRIDQIVSELKFKGIKIRLKAWISSGGNDLYQGIGMLAELVDTAHHQAKQGFIVGSLRNEVWLELNNRLTALEKIRLVSYYFFEKHGLRLDFNNPGHPSRFSLNRLVIDRAGNEFSLAAAYAILSRALDLPVFGVNIPGYPLLAYLDLPLFPNRHFNPEDFPVIFFIHPGDNGRLLGMNEAQYLAAAYYPDYDESEIKPCSDLLFAKKYTIAMAKSCRKAGKIQTALRAEELADLWETD